MFISILISDASALKGRRLARQNVSRGECIIAFAVILNYKSIYASRNA